MIKETYKPGKHISSDSNKNNYKQFYWFGGVLWYKGYWKNDKNIGYEERHTEWKGKGIKYIL